MSQQDHKQLQKALKASMTAHIVDVCHGLHQPTFAEMFDPWAKANEKPLLDHGYLLTVQWARLVMQRLLKEAAQPEADDAQAFFEGMEIFKHLPKRFPFGSPGTKNRYTDTIYSTHAQRLKFLQMMEAQGGFVAASRNHMQKLDEWSLPFIQKYGDRPLIELIRLHQASDGVIGASQKGG